MGSSPTSGSVLTAQNLLGILSLPPSIPSLLALSPSLKINKQTFKKITWRQVFGRFDGSGDKDYEEFSVEEDGKSTIKRIFPHSLTQ